MDGLLGSDRVKLMLKCRKLTTSVKAAEQKLEAAALNLSVTADCIAQAQDSIVTLKAENGAMNRKMDKMFTLI